MAKKDSDINIKNVTGNIIISQGQSGGMTAHDNSPQKNTKKKSFFKNKYTLTIGFVASLLGILSYFGLQPTIKGGSEKLNQKNEISKTDTISTLNDTTKIKSTHRPMIKKNEDENNVKSAPISVKNVTGNVVISQGQSGGITAHTVNVEDDLNAFDLNDNWVYEIDSTKKEIRIWPPVKRSISKK